MKIVLGATLVDPPKDVAEKQLINPTRAAMTSGGVGLSTVSFHDQPAYKTPS